MKNRKLAGGLAFLSLLTLVAAACGGGGGASQRQQQEMVDEATVQTARSPWLRAPP